MPELSSKLVTKISFVTIMLYVIPAPVIICSSHSSHNHVSMYLFIVNKL